MDFRMYQGNIPIGENVVPLIIKSLNDNGERQKSPLKMVAFEGEPETPFRLNNHKETIEIPSSGKFYTPYQGERFMPIYSLIFTEGFDGKIYYII